MGDAAKKEPAGDASCRFFTDPSLDGPYRRTRCDD
jgi:hypothetical protein